MSPLTKRERRQANFGKRNTVRPTMQRTYHGEEHRPPVGTLNHNGTAWLGFSRASKRKPWPVEASWRDWLRSTGRAA